MITLRTILVAVVLLVGVLAEAQQAGKPRRIGYLLTGFQPPKEFLDSMGRLGYVEGKNIIYEIRTVEGREARLTELAAELVRLGVEVIVAPGAAAGLAAKQATKNVPVIYMGGGDPVELGIVDSLARPGGNVTGITDISAELTGKRLELIKEAFPKVSNVAVLQRAHAPGITSQRRNLETDARALGFTLVTVEINGATDFEMSFTTILKRQAGALIELPNPLFHANSKRIVDFSLKNRLPTIFHSKDFVEIGGLMSYGADFVELYHRAAIHVDKLLKGTKPADIPVEQPMKFELVINLKTAKKIGVTIPQWTLMKADRVIK